MESSDFNLNNPRRCLAEYKHQEIEAYSAYGKPHLVLTNEGLTAGLKSIVVIANLVDNTGEPIVLPYPPVIVEGKLAFVDDNALARALKFAGFLAVVMICGVAIFYYKLKKKEAAVAESRQEVYELPE